MPARRGALRRAGLRAAGRLGGRRRLVARTVVAEAGAVGLASLAGQRELAGDGLARRRALARARGRSWRPSPGARTCRCCRRRPGAGRSGRGACCSPTRTILPSLTAITGAPRRAKILIPRRCLRTLDHQCTVTLLARALRELLGVALGEVVGVGGLRRDGEVALGQAGERADEVGRQAADQARAHEDGVDVPVGVVVGEDRLAQVLLGAGGLEVARGGEDRVDRVVRVLQLVLVGVDAVLLPRRGHELHPPERAGGGDVEVAAVVGLDLVDRREDLPAHAVLDAGGLVEREQEGRDAELVDEEVRHADRRGAGHAPARRSGCRASARRRARGRAASRGPSSRPRARARRRASWQLRLPARKRLVALARACARGTWPAREPRWVAVGRAGLLVAVRAWASTWGWACPRGRPGRSGRAAPASACGVGVAIGPLSMTCLIVPVMPGIVTWLSGRAGRHVDGRPGCARP